MKRTSNKDIVLEEFDNFSEFINTNKTRTVLFDTNDAIKHQIERNGELDNKKWYGVKSLEEAQNKLLLGDTSLMKKIKKNLDNETKAKTITRVRTKQFNDVVGYAPVVPNAIMGLPQSMINSKRVTRKTKILSIMVEVGFSCGVSQKEVIDFGSRLLQKIKELEMQGYRIRLTVGSCFATNRGGKHKVSAFKVKVKSESQPLDIKRIAWALTSTAMLRVLGFDWYECCPDAEMLCAYGQPVHSFSQREQDRIKNMMCKPNEVYITMGSDLDKIFEQTN